MVWHLCFIDSARLTDLSEQSSVCKRAHYKRTVCTQRYSREWRETVMRESSSHMWVLSTETLAHPFWLLTHCSLRSVVLTLSVIDTVKQHLKHKIQHKNFTASTEARGNNQHKKKFNKMFHDSHDCVDYSFWYQYRSRPALKTTYSYSVWKIKGIDASLLTTK